MLFRSTRKSAADSDDDGDGDGETKESDGEELEKLKVDAITKRSSVDLEHIEKSTDKVHIALSVKYFILT